jgi:predicted methyltransferase
MMKFCSDIVTLSHPRAAAATVAMQVITASLVSIGGCSNLGTSTSGASARSSVTLTKTQIESLLASPDRTAADRTNDLRRKPDQMLDFIGIRAGMVALDLSTGGGYTTELLARAVGPTGSAYGQSQPPRPVDAPPRPPVTPEGNANPQLQTAQTPTPATPPPRRTSAQALAERAKNPTLSNLFSVVRVFEDPVPPELSGKLDLVTLMFNYHDLGHMGIDRSRMNAAVFASLKPGGIYVIADHAGRAGTDISEAGTLHRIEEAFLQKEVEAAGFKVVAHGDFLRNPLDPRDKNTPEPAQPKDEFVLNFVKP